METIIGSLIGAVATLAAVWLGHRLKSHRATSRRAPHLDHAFAEVFTSVHFVRWRERREGTAPLESGRLIAHLSGSFAADVWDESICLSEWKPIEPESTTFRLDHSTSGLVFFESIPPHLPLIDEAMHQRTQGRHTQSTYPTLGPESIRYITHRFNAFQESEQNFTFPTQQFSIEKLEINLNFSPLFGATAFRRLPRAHLSRDDNTRPAQSLALTTWYGRNWTLTCRDLHPQQRVIISWELCDGKPDGPIYVFGYGSLMHPASLKRSVVEEPGAKTPAFPAVLRGFRKTWTALARNVGDGETIEGQTPPYVAYLNIDSAEESEAVGLLVRVRHDDLERLDQRETVYIRIDVTQAIRPLNRRHSLEPGAVVFTYISLPPERLMSPAHPGAAGARQDYIDLLVRACDRLAETEPSERDRFLADKERILKGCSDLPRLYPRNPREQARYRV